MNAKNNQIVQDFDVIIIGAGINGAGLFKDLSINGLTCLIIDKNDFGAGTSAASSRLIHGGIKYLETAEFKLVAQSTFERNLLLKNAPHFVKPLPTFIPAFSWFKGSLAAIRTLFGSTTAPRSRGAALIKIGMSIYDFYGSRSRVMPKHKFLRRAAALKNIPQITPRIKAAGIYYDAKVTQPERLVYELITDALAANNDSAAYNYASINDMHESGISFENANCQKIIAQAKIVVNAAGPWIDSVNYKIGIKKDLIGGTKGSHILLNHPDLLKVLDGKMVYFEADDGRICLAFEYHGLALIGSTDIKANNPDDVLCEDNEIDYFLQSIKSLFPSLDFDKSQIVYCYSGIRPLPLTNFDQPALISRDHSAPIIEADKNRQFAIISLVGGKWTTFRGFAEEVANLIFTRLGTKRIQSTQNLAIGGGKNYPAHQNDFKTWLEQQVIKSKLSKQRITDLFERYGMLSERIMTHIVTKIDDRPIHGLAEYSTGEIDWIARHEMVVSLSDIIMRRTTLALEGKVNLAMLDDIAAITALALNWDAKRIDSEISTLIAYLAKFHNFHLKE